MTDDLPREEVMEVVDRAVAELLEAAGVRAPPVDAIALARHLGLTVSHERRPPQRGRAQRPSGSRQIILDPEATEEHQQWTVAHAIGGHMKASLLQRLGVEPPQTRAPSGESLATLFAYHLLVPTAWFAVD